MLNLLLCSKDVFTFLYKQALQYNTKNLPQHLQTRSGVNYVSSLSQAFSFFLFLFFFKGRSKLRDLRWRKVSFIFHVLLKKEETWSPITQLKIKNCCSRTKVKVWWGFLLIFGWGFFVLFLSVCENRVLPYRHLRRWQGQHVLYTHRSQLPSVFGSASKAFSFLKNNISVVSKFLRIEILDYFRNLAHLIVQPTQHWAVQTEFKKSYQKHPGKCDWFHSKHTPE